MPYEPPMKVTATEYRVRVQEIEGILRPPESPKLKIPYEPKIMKLKDGSELVIRQATIDEAPRILKAIKPYFEVDKDFYDIVSVRTYAEVLGWLRKRIKDHFILIGIREGTLVGIANARLWNDDIVISLHTMAFVRGLNVGPIMYLAKMEHSFDFLGAKEWWATYESYIGFKTWAIKLAQQQKPWPEYQHELGGARVYYNTKYDWEHYIKPHYKHWIEGIRPVPKEVLEKTKDFKVIEEPIV